MVVRRPKRSEPLSIALIAQLQAGEPLHGAELARRTRSTQPPVWRTLRALEEAGQVRSRKVGTVRFYELNSGPEVPATAQVRAARRAVQRIALRRASRGSGSDLAAMMQRRRLMDWWGAAVRALNGIPHAVVGGVAAAAYMPGRNTDDIDIAVGVESVEQSDAALSLHGWSKLGALDVVDGSAWQDADDHALDLITLNEPWAQESIAAASRNIIAGLPTMPLPFLVLMKLHAGRLSDMGDVARMLGLATEDVRTEARTLVGRFGGSEDVEDLEQVILLGLLEATTATTTP